MKLKKIIKKMKKIDKNGKDLNCLVELNIEKYF